MTKLQVDEWLLYIDQIIEEANKQANEFTGASTLNWEALQWSDKGPSGLFDQFKIAGAWCEMITSRRLTLEHKRNEVIGVLGGWQVEVTKKIEGYVATNAKKWVQSGMAYQERSSLARIETGDDAYYVSVIEKKLEHLNAILSLLKAKADQFASFKNDAKTAAQLMTFGHQLGELK